MKRKPTRPVLIPSAELCQRLGIGKATLADWRKLGLEPDRVGPGKGNKRTAFWDLLRVRQWTADHIEIRSVSEVIETGAEKAKDKTYSFDHKKGAGGTFDDLLERLSQVEQIEFARYGDALKSGDAKAVYARRKAWLDSIEQIRRIERDAPEVKRQKGELVSKADADAEMIRMCLTVKQAMLGLKGSLPVLLVGRDEAEMSILIDKAIRDACVALTAGDKELDARIDKMVKELTS